MAKDTHSTFDFSWLMSPALAFYHPRDVVADPDLTLNEKRAILASWASDARALEVTPALSEITKVRIVPLDDIMDALRSLDRSVTDNVPHYDRALRRRKISRSGCEGGSGSLKMK